jgi:hypothetical protein
LILDTVATPIKFRFISEENEDDGRISFIRLGIPGAYKIIKDPNAVLFRLVAGRIQERINLHKDAQVDFWIVTNQHLQKVIKIVVLEVMDIRK